MMSPPHCAIVLMLPTSRPEAQGQGAAILRFRRIIYRLGGCGVQTFKAGWTYTGTGQRATGIAVGKTPPGRLSRSWCSPHRLSLFAAALRGAGSAGDSSEGCHLTSTILHNARRKGRSEGQRSCSLDNCQRKTPHRALRHPGT